MTHLELDGGADEETLRVVCVPNCPWDSTFGQMVVERVVRL